MAEGPDLSAVVAQAIFSDRPPDAPMRVGVAVSGGGDSVALLHAARLAGLEVRAVTVDHGLRPDARAEAEGVARLCAGLGVPHDILTWQGAEASGNLMDAARRARLHLIGGWARGLGLSHVLLGHTADDEAETFLMRLGRSAGLEGLSGMRPRFQAEGVVWHRPLLRVGRADLRDWLRARHIPWVDDPSNENPRFTRVRARKALAALAPVGITPETLARTIAHLAEANRALDAVLAEWLARHGQESGGAIRIAADPFAALDPELRRRLLVAALQWLSGADYAPRAAKVAGLMERATGQGAFRATLHGCRIARSRGHLVLTREPRAVEGLRVPADSGLALWDQWRVAGPGAPGLSVAMLGAAALRPLPPVPLPDKAALAVSPAIWQGERLIAAPLAGLSNGWSLHNERGTFT